ncbi:MFS transporter [Victivallis vadensis]|uniref:MFS transporter n=1 Tax=Victivallis vadensis TaxID=172901 RepID=UPI001D5D911D|nr:MFS transporter [Victivallis vadensis]HJH05566.1 MFS transporter [Victivallis vadensis]
MAEAKEQKIWRAGTLTYTTTGIILLFIWLLWGDFAWGLKERSVGYVAGLMVKSFGISDFVYTVMMVSFPCFTNIFLMPIISYRSDRHRGRWGRRIPFLMKTTPFVVVGLIGLGFTPMLGNWLSAHIGADRLSVNMASLLVFGFFWILLDFGTTLTNAIFVALANDVVPTALIGRFLALFRAVSLICAMLFNAFLLGHAETHSMWIFISLGIFYCIGLYSICLKVKEGKYPPPVDDGSDDHRRSFFSAVRVYFRECFSMPYYRWVILAQVCCSHSVLPLNTFVIFYAKDLGLSMGTFGKITAGIFLTAVIMSFALGFLSDKFHPIRTGIASMSLLLVVQVVAWLVIRDITTFVIFFVAHELTIMAFNTLMASYTQRLFPKALYAQFNSALQMLLAIAAVLIAPVVGVILDGLDHNYVYVFILGAAIGVVGLFSLFKVYRYYLKYGGDENYQAPLPEAHASKEEAA